MSNWVSQKTYDILIFLYNSSEPPNFTTLQNGVGGSNTTIDKALKILSQENLIEEKRVPNKSSKGSVIIGESRVTVLTPKGKKVAQKLKEIEEIME